MTRFIASPRPYVAWAVIVIVALLSTRWVDPYLFGVTTLLAGGATVAVGLVGIYAQFRLGLPQQQRRGIAWAVIAAVAAVFVALAWLRTVNWA